MSARVPLFLTLILCLALPCCGRRAPETTDTSPSLQTHLSKGPKVTCPVCGLSFPEKEAVGTVTVKGKKYFFYLEDHMKAFKTDPESFLEK